MNPTVYPARRKPVWPWIAVAFAALFCAVGVIAAIGSADQPGTLEPGLAANAAPSATELGVVPADEPETVAPPAKPVTPAGPLAVVLGDDIVLVGTDVQAGTYRAAQRIEPDRMCYWKKSKDAEGDDIIDNDIPSGGRPQVTLKKGQWFTSSNCPEWHKK